MLASETFSPTSSSELPSAEGDVYWALADNLGTVRDIVAYDSGTGQTSVVNHIEYDAFGNITGESASPGMDYALERYLYSYTGREWDADAEMYAYRARWYDPVVGRFISEDPIGFAAGDTNVSRYVGNGVTNATDPSGLEAYQRPDLGRQKISELTATHPDLMKHYIRLYGKEGLQLLYDAFTWGYNVVVADDWTDDAYTIDCLTITIDSEHTAIWSGDEDTHPVDRARALFDAVRDPLITPPKTKRSGETSAGDISTHLDPNRTQHQAFRGAVVEINQLLEDVRNDIIFELSGIGAVAVIANKVDNVNDLLKIRHFPDGIVRKVAGTRGLQHSYDRHAAEWFCRHGGQRTIANWESLVTQAANSTKIVEWSTGADKTIGHLARIDGNKWFFVQFFKEGTRAGELATAFIPNKQQLNAILKLLGK